MIKSTIKNLIENAHEEDIDVCDNYTEECYIAYCGTKLTEAGKEKFQSILDIPIEIHSNVIIIDVDEGDTPDDECERRLKLVKKMFYGMAGYCSEEAYNKYFYDED